MTGGCGGEGRQDLHDWSPGRLQRVIAINANLKDGDYREAVSAASELRDDLRGDTLVAPFELLGAEILLGLGLNGLGEYQEAELVFAGVIQEQESKSLIIPKLFLSALNGLAESYVGRGLHAEAAEAIKKFYHFYENTDDSCNSINLRSDLASALKLDGGLQIESRSFAGARDVLSRAALLYEQLEEDVIGYMTTLYYLGIVEYEINNISLAKKRIDLALKLAATHDQNSSGLFAQISILAAAINLDKGKFEEARHNSREAIFLMKEFYGHQDICLAQPLCNLGHAEMALGNHREAEVRYREALELLVRQFGEERVDVADVLRYLGVLYSDALIDHTMARECFLRACRIYCAQYGEEHIFYRESLWSLACSYAGEGDFKQSLPILVSALALYREDVDEDPLFYVERIFSAIRIAAKANDSGMISDLLGSISEYCRGLGAENEQLVDFYSRLASFLGVIGRKAGARDYFELALKLRRKLSVQDGRDVALYESEFSKWKELLKRAAEQSRISHADTDVMEISHISIPGLKMSSRLDKDLSAEVIAHIVSTAVCHIENNRKEAACQLIEQLIESKEELVVQCDPLNSLYQSLQ